MGTGGPMFAAVARVPDVKGLTVPSPTEDFTADPVELFFDLAFVFAFSQLVSHLVHHPTWQGASEATLLFLILWRFSTKALERCCGSSSSSSYSQESPALDTATGSCVRATSQSVMG